MKKKTVNVSGIGRMYVNTDLDSIKVAGFITDDGTPGNWFEKRVSRDKRHFSEADQNDWPNDAPYLKHMNNEFFMIVYPA